MLELDGEQEFEAARDAEFFAGLPARPGVLLVEMRDPRAQPYLARTADVRRAAERLLTALEQPSKRLNLRELARGVRYRPTGSKFEQTLTHYQQARAYFPERYRELVRLRPAAMLKVNLASEYPRCYVTRTIRGDAGFYFGPFASRKAADAFGKAFLDLFKIRRCQIKIRRDPSFPGCIYSEMKMCLAPCFAGCTRQDYHEEVGRVVESLATQGAALTEEIEREREKASEALDFEHAAALHKRLEKVSNVMHGLPGIARRLADLNILILQRAAQDNTIAAFPARGGVLGEPIFLRFGELSSEPRSAEAILRAGLEPEGALAAPKPAKDQLADNGRAATESADPRRQRFGLHQAPAELSEHLSLIARWFYSNPRDGEIFFREADWPYRRILRACGRLLTAPNPGASGEAPAAERLAALSRERIKRLQARAKPRRKPAP